MPKLFQADPDILKHLREEKGQKQCTIASELGMSERGYQKIEATGRTSTVTAKRLCMILGVSLDELSGVKKPELKTEYWIKSPVTGVHQILSSPQEVMSVLGPMWADFKRCFEPENEERPSVDVSSENGRYQLLSKLDAYNKKWEVEFRRIRFMESKGLIWVRESKLEENIMSSSLEGFFRENADEVRINGVTKYIDEGGFIVVIDEWKLEEKVWSTLAEVEFERLDELKRQLIGTLKRYVPDEIKVRRSILDMFGFGCSAGIMLDVWPKIHSRSDCYEGVVNPIRIGIARSISSDSEVQSSWLKESKQILISDLIAVATDYSGDVLNSRLVDWATELGLQEGG